MIPGCVKSRTDHGQTGKDITPNSELQAGEQRKSLRAKDKCTGGLLSESELFSLLVGWD